MSKSFNGYLFDQFGRYSSPEFLNGATEVFEFCELHKLTNFEIRIVEPVDDAIVVKTINGKYVFPEEWKKFNTGEGTS